MTGVMDGSYRVTAIYRNQWNSVMVPFSTAGVSADVNTNKNISFGLNILSQSAGDAGYKYQQADIDIAYSGVRFGKDHTHQVTFGFQFGLLGRKFDPSKFRAGDQWNPGIGFDPSRVSADVYGKTSTSVFDIGAGVSYMSLAPANKLNVFAGFAAAHLTKPEDPFLAAGTKNYLPVRYTGHIGVKLNASDQLSITPHLLYMKQGNSNEKMLGIYGEYILVDETSLFTGINYRFDDAIAPMVGFAFNGLSIGVSYDINNSDLGKAVPGTNSFELSVTWRGRRADKMPFNFGCPRL
jgi:type IX secretion system PorP/SprF family membrane protein